MGQGRSWGVAAPRKHPARAGWQPLRRSCDPKQPLSGVWELRCCWGAVTGGPVPLLGWRVPVGQEHAVPVGAGGLSRSGAGGT